MANTQDVAPQDVTPYKVWRCNDLTSQGVTPQHVPSQDVATRNGVANHV